MSIASLAMTKLVDQMIDATIGKEGGYSDHPADKGGPTRWGITERVARRNGYSGAMRELPREKAVEIYRREFLIEPGFDKVAELLPRVAEELFDTGVNMGPAVPALWLQEWLNAFNSSERLYADIREDADIGPATLAALAAYKRSRGAAAETVMLKALNGSQTERYKELAVSRKGNEAFVFGWLSNRVGF